MLLQPMEQGWFSYETHSVPALAKMETLVIE